MTPPKPNTESLTPRNAILRYAYRDNWTNDMAHVLRLHEEIELESADLQSRNNELSDAFMKAMEGALNLKGESAAKDNQKEYLQLIIRQFISETTADNNCAWANKELQNRALGAIKDGIGPAQIESMTTIKLPKFD